MKWQSRKGYSLVQLVGVLSCCLILSSVTIMGYQKFIEKSRMAVCTTNQKALVNALIDYTLENNALPATLGNLKLKHLEKGYAQAMAEVGWFVKLAHFAVKTDMSSEAYAQFLTYDNLKNYGVGKDNLKCPSDPNGGVSYGMNSNVAGKAWVQIANNVIVVGDCDSSTFSSSGSLRKNHKDGTVAVGRTKGGAVVEIDESGSVSTIGGGNDDSPTFSDNGTSSVDTVAAAGDAQSIVDAVLAAGFTNGVESALLDKLDGIVADIESNDTTAALGKLDEFVQKTQNDIDHNRITESEGNALIDMANDLTDVFGG